MPEVQAELGIVNFAGLRGPGPPAQPAELGKVQAVGKRSFASSDADLGIVLALGLVARAEPWYAIYYEADGALWSVTSSLGDLPDGLSSVELDGRPDFRAVMWDQASLSFVARPPSSKTALVDQLLYDADFPTDITASERAEIREIFERIYSDYF